MTSNSITGQLSFYRQDLKRQGLMDKEIEKKIEEKKVKLEALEKQYKAKTRPFTNKPRDLTYGQYPWLPLCDL